MRTLAICCCVALMAGCAKPDQQAVKDTTGATLGAGATPTPITLAAVAGNWTIHTMAANSDSVLLTFNATVPGDGSDWTFAFPGRAPVSAHIVATDADSIVTEAGPYESALRKGVQVSTRSVMRLQDGKLVGNTVAHYMTSGSDSVLNLRTEGTRAP
jgi:hypothetical protein